MAVFQFFTRNANNYFRTWQVILFHQFGYFGDKFNNHAVALGVFWKIGEN